MFIYWWKLECKHAEYNLKGIVSKKGDIYSYGTMLMEPFARKKAIDGMFLGLKTWVKSSANNIVKVIYANLLKEENECFSLKRVCFFPSWH